MFLLRENKIKPMRQADIEAAYMRCISRRLGHFGAEFLREEVLSYLKHGHAFCCIHRTDDEFLSMFRQNETDMLVARGVDQKWHPDQDVASV